MATDNIAAYEVNNYLYSLIGSLLNDSGSDYNPIFPIQDQPETNDLTGTYLVYTVRTAPNPDQWWVVTDDLTYVIWNTDLEKIQPIVNTLIDAFRREDDTAADINAYLDSIGHNDFRFLTFNIIGTSLPNPTSSENARYGQPFNIRYDYVINNATGYN